MRRIIFFRLGTRNLHLPKLIGAFIFFAALLLVLQSISTMFETWQMVADFPSCISDAAGTGQLSFMKYVDCKDALYKTTGIVVRGGETQLSMKQYFVALTAPIVYLFFWLAVFLAGVMVYKSGSLVIPIEESVRQLREKIRKKSR
ncbi:MAG: hypothetical protein AB1467_00155 [Candidatus Diapherotrites archaeon]